MLAGGNTERERRKEVAKQREEERERRWLERERGER
jgi:hypothetical protein